MCRTINGADCNFDESYIKNIRSVIGNGTLYDDMVSAAQKPGRGNIAPTTIILPTLAMQAKEKVDGQYVQYLTDEAQQNAYVEAFMKLLEKKINEAKDSLLERFDWICSQPASSAKFMYENGTFFGYKPEEGIRSALKHGTLAIGQLGLAETLEILIGCNHAKPEGMELAKRIEKLFNEKCAKFKKEYKLNFGVYYTPAENLCYTAMNRFREKYGEIPKVSDHDYFTNSIHVPVWETMTPFEKIDLESQLTGYSNAGCITYVELDSSAKNNLQAVEELVQYAMDRDIPYLGINLPNDTCNSCGYTDEIGVKCPQCGSTDIMRLRRVTGYLSTDYRNFNLGKQQEVEHRTTHTNVEV